MRDDRPKGVGFGGALDGGQARVPDLAYKLADALWKDGARALDIRGEQSSETPTANAQGALTVAHRMAEIPSRVELINPPYNVVYYVSSADRAKWTKRSVQVTLDRWHQWESGTVEIAAANTSVTVALRRPRYNDAGIAVLVSVQHAATGTHDPVVHVSTTTTNGQHTAVVLGPADGAAMGVDATLNYVVMTGTSASDELNWRVS